MKVSHILPSPDYPITSTQDMRPGDIGLVYGRYVLCLPGKNGFLVLEGRTSLLSAATDRPVDILPEGTNITVIVGDKS
jgi:hypothetical protein